jgi:hypothetical protein
MKKTENKEKAVKNRLPRKLRRPGKLSEKRTSGETFETLHYITLSALLDA